MRIAIFTAAAALAFSASAAAQGMKPGLWEVTNKMGGNAQLEQAQAQMQAQLAAMPPEQRRQMEAMMAQRGMGMPGAGPGGASSVRVCMTKEMSERNDVPMQQGCSVTKSQRSGNTVNVAFTCSSPPASGEGTFTTLGPDAYSSKMKITTMAQGRQETMTMEGSGKWVGADCGSIQPMGQPRR